MAKAKKKSSSVRAKVPANLGPEMTLHTKQGSFAPMASGRLQKGAMKNYRGKGKP